MKEVAVGGDNINNLRYADDTALLTCNEKDLQDIVPAVNDKEKPYGMEMSVMKTKTMVISRSKQTPISTSQLKESPSSKLKRWYI